MGKKGSGKKRKRGADIANRGKNKSEGKGKPVEGKGKRRRLATERPERAFIVCSASPQQSPKATREAQLLLSSAVDAMWKCDVREDAVATQQQTSVSSALEAELQELRGEDADGSKNDRRRFITFRGEVLGGVAVLGCPSSAVAPSFPAPSELVKSVFESQNSVSGVSARFVVRLFPLDVVCPPHLNNFRTAAAAALPALFADASRGATWYITFFCRAMKTIKRDDALTVLKEVLSPLGFDISVSDAEYTVLVEVNPALCGFSVLQDYEKKLHECNLQRAQCRAGAPEELDCDDHEGSDDSSGIGSDAEASPDTAVIAETEIKLAAEGTVGGSDQKPGTSSGDTLELEASTVPESDDA